MPEIILPKRTTGYLAAGAANGQRHTECKAAALQLRDAGISQSEAESTLVDRGERDGLKREEVVKVVAWAYSKPAREPIVVGTSSSFCPVTITPPKAAPRSPLDTAKWWLNGATMAQDAFVSRSQLPIPPDARNALVAFLEMLYEGTDKVNVVCQLIEEGGKARPCGGGKVLTRDEWLKWISGKGIPQSKAGAWFRPNPCQAGSGKDGAIMDSDILSHRFLLLESDTLPLPVQFALFAKLKLPIAAAYLSGGSSVHCLVNLSCASEKEFSAAAVKIMALLKPMGIDPANKNPSRLSRLPGATRIIGAVDTAGTEQKLLWLNPAAKPLTPEGLEAFELSLTFPAVEDKPFKKIIQDAISRYEELASHPGLTGVPTGLADFDRDTGGLQKCQMTVIASESNGGKSSLAANILNGALHAGHGAALFTLEMGNDEIADLFFAMNCQVDRNHFNTGEFTEMEMVRMVGESKRIANLPLWTYDESSLTVAQIRQRILALKSENLISLAVVDYAQIVTPGNLNVNREQQVAGIARALCACAKDAKIPIIVLSQLNDEMKLRESRVMSHEAHNVIMIENKEAEGKMILHVIKGRRIRKRDYNLAYEPVFCRIKSLAIISDQDMPNNHRNPTND